MTKKELIDKINAFPDDSLIDIYDLRDYSHPYIQLNCQDYYDYDNGLPILTFELFDKEKSK